MLVPVVYQHRRPFYDTTSPPWPPKDMDPRHCEQEHWELPSQHRHLLAAPGRDGAVRREATTLASSAEEKGNGAPPLPGARIEKSCRCRARRPRRREAEGLRGKDLHGKPAQRSAWRPCLNRHCSVADPTPAPSHTNGAPASPVQRGHRCQETRHVHSVSQEGCGYGKEWDAVVARVAATHHSLQLCPGPGRHAGPSARRSHRVNRRLPRRRRPPRPPAPRRPLPPASAARH